MKMTNKNVRNVALDLLLRIEKSGGFSHLLISHAIDKGDIHPKDEALLTTLVYGTLERKLTLQDEMNRLVQSKKQLADWIEMLLCLSIFQLRYLDNVPAYAVIDEAVTIAKKRGHKGIGSLVNGVLRNAVRKGAPDYTSLTDDVVRLSLETSHPTWLVQKWIDEYGYEKTKRMCAVNVTTKALSIRVNTTKTTRESVLEKLNEQGIIAAPSPYNEYAIIIQEGNLFKTNMMKDGLVSIQDISSMLAAQYVQVEKNQTVLDCCSAPGGKTTFLAERLEQTGKVHAYDIHKNKTKLIQENVDRLGLTNVIVGQHDAKKLQDKYNQHTFDRIIVDAPCSGLGIIRTKPDIKYNKTQADINQLADVQLNILREIVPLMKETGKLVYSTCTITKEENEQVVQAFLQEHPHIQVEPSFLKEVKGQSFEDAVVSNEGLQLFPQSCNGDGFFITRFVVNGPVNGV